MQNRKIRLVLLLLCSAVPIYGFAQELPPITYRPEVEPIFENGIILYNNGKYAEAYETFSKLLDGNRWHQRLTAALLMRAKASYMLHNDKAAEADLRELAKIHPKSRYIGHAQILMGLIHFQRGDYLSTARNFLMASDFPLDPRVRQKGEEISRILLRDYLDLNDIERLLPRVSSINAQALLVKAKAEKLLEHDAVEKARATIDTFLSAHPGTRYHEELLDLREADRLRRPRRVKLGFLLPLSGELSPEGQAVLRGIRFAEQQMAAQADAARGIVYEVRDSQSRMLKAVREMQRLMNDREVLCVAGELDAMITAGLAGMAQTRGVPFIAPATSENGFSEIGDMVFQANPDYETRARAIAAYAIDSLQLHTFITLAPQDEYGRQMVDAFSAEIDRRGGEILTQRWYFGLPENLGRQFRFIREIALRRAFEDTARVKIPDFTNLDKDSLWRAHTMQVMLEGRLNQTPAELPGFYPVHNIDAIFLPIYTEDIKFVARQLSYYNINAQILGDEKWYMNDLGRDRDLLRYIDGAIFASSFFIATESPTYRNFRDEFRLALGTTPERWELLGYDLASLLHQTARQVGGSRNAFKESLEQITDFRGLRGDISFAGKKRVNNVVYLLQIRNNRYVRLLQAPPF